MRPLRITLTVIGIAQVFFGILFIAAPDVYASLVGLAAVPAWAYWVFALFSARAFGFAYGMFLAARDPIKYIGWIQAMIAVQVLDWLVTVYYLLSQAVSLAQVTTASFMPLVFIVLLAIFYPRGAARQQAPA